MDILQALTNRQIDLFNNHVDLEIKHKLVMLTEKAYEQGEFELHCILCSVDFNNPTELISELANYGYRLELVTPPTPNYETRISFNDKYTVSCNVDFVRLKVTKTLFEI